MKTPEEIKKGLDLCPGQYSNIACRNCPYSNKGVDCGSNGVHIMADALAYIQQLEAKFSQVSKALCKKENATLEEVLQAVSQVKAELAAVKRERDAAVSELPHHCWNCKYHLDNPIEETDDNGRTIHRYCDADCCFPEEENSSWEWRGVCPENTEVKEDAAK